MERERARYHHGDLRRALLGAGARLVARHGASEVSLRAIAREAGVSPAAPYHHFDDREALLAAVAASGFEMLREEMTERADRAPSDEPMARLQGAGVGYVTFAMANPELFRLMFGGIVSDRSRAPELETASERTWETLRELLGPAAGGSEGGSLPAVAVTTWSTVHGLAFLMIEGLLEEEIGTAGPEALAEAVTRVLGRGLRSYVVPGAE